MTGNRSLALLIMVTFSLLLVLWLSIYVILKDTNMNHPGSGQIDNHIENSVDADHAEVNNSIENHINNNGHTDDVDNHVRNDLDVSVNVSVDNHIENRIETDSTNEEDEDGNENGNENGEENDKSPEFVWGVDSASLTTEDMLACVEDNFGDPQVWGRYLGDNEGVSYGLTEDEVDRLHENNIQILVIWNHFTDATGYEHGQNEAMAAVEKAEKFGIPESVALFANVEPIYPVDAEFITGWHEALMDSDYSSGIYGIFDTSEELHEAYTTAAEAQTELLDQMYIWTAAPHVGITTEEDAPEYNPEYPEGSLLGGWQYGIDAETCNIDTNLFDENLFDVLW